MNFRISSSSAPLRRKPGTFLPFTNVDLNQLDLATIGQYQSGLLNTMVPNQWAAIQPSTNSNYGSPTVPLFVQLQQFPQFGNGGYGGGNGVLVHGYPGGDSDYSSLQTKIQKRLTNHFTALASFTWAKLMTDDGTLSSARLRRYPPGCSSRLEESELRALGQPAGCQVSISPDRHRTTCP